MRRFPAYRKGPGYFIQGRTCDVVASVERALRSKAPLPLPVAVRLVCGLSDREKNCGQQRLAFNPATRKPEFVIELDAELTPDEAADTLVHEWAHALAHKAPGDQHGKAWGLAFSRCYRASQTRRRSKS